MINLKGEVEVIGKENGKIIHYDKGPNLVTFWARHAVMHLLTGDTFSGNGKMRAFAGHTTTANPDGTLISGQQYFHNNVTPTYNEDFFWNKSTIENSFPFMPTKMLFGTGYEFTDYTELSGEDVEDDWESTAIFNNNIENEMNSVYSNNTLTNSSTFPTKTRTVNSSLSAVKSEPEINQQDFAINGAIKNGNYGNEGEKEAKTVIDSTYGRISKPEYRGIGEPCFIYPQRSNTFENESSQVMLTPEGIWETNEVESKITFTVVMPEQTGSNADDFYPYNGYMIKEAGLFCDSFLFNENESANYDRRMPYGIMFAKRYISPFRKTANSSFTIRWTIYI